MAQLDGKQIKDSSIADGKLVETYINQDGSVAFTANQSMGNNRLTNLADGTGAQDAVNLRQLQDAITGLDVKGSCRAATTTALTGATYNATGGASGRGQFTTVGDTTIDGVALVDGDRVLVKNQASAAQNGIWVATDVAGGTWDRAGDFDEDFEGTANAFTFISEGTTLADTGWIMTSDDPVTVGGGSGSAINWVQFSSAGIILAGDGLQKIGNTISVLPDGDSVSASGTGLKSSVPVLDNKDMTALVTTIDGDDATATTVAKTPGGNSYVQVLINGQMVSVGDGVLTKDSYFSGDGGTTARAIAAIVAGDTLHWNGSIAGYQLAATDRIDLNYAAII